MLPAGLWVLDAILAGMAAEAAALTVLHRLRGIGVPPAALLPNLCAGFALLLAMRLALGGAWWGLVCTCLLAALIGHLTDLNTRWNRPTPLEPPAPAGKARHRPEKTAKRQSLPPRERAG